LDIVFLKCLFKQSIVYKQREQLLEFTNNIISFLQRDQKCSKVRCS